MGKIQSNLFRVNTISSESTTNSTDSELIHKICNVVYRMLTEDTGEWYICHTTDKNGFTVWKDKRCARFSAGFIVRRIMLQAKVERKTVQFMIAKAPIEVGGTVYYKILLSNPIFK